MHGFSDDHSTHIVLRHRTNIYRPFESLVDHWYQANPEYVPIFLLEYHEQVAYYKEGQLDLTDE